MLLLLVFLLIFLACMRFMVDMDIHMVEDMDTHMVEDMGIHIQVVMAEITVIHMVEMQICKVTFF